MNKDRKRHLFQNLIFSVTFDLLKSSKPLHSKLYLVHYFLEKRHSLNKSNSHLQNQTFKNAKVIAASKEFSFLNQWQTF